MYCITKGIWPFLSGKCETRCPFPAFLSFQFGTGLRNMCSIHRPQDTLAFYGMARSLATNVWHSIHAPHTKREMCFYRGRKALVWCTYITFSIPVEWQTRELKLSMHIQEPHTVLHKRNQWRTPISNAYVTWTGITSPPNKKARWKHQSKNDLAPM